MTTSIDLEDVRKNPQDYLMDGEEITEVAPYVYWLSKPVGARLARLSGAVNAGRITRKPKTRKIKVRPWVTLVGTARTWTEGEVSPSDGFIRWAGPEQEIEVNT